MPATPGVGTELWGLHQTPLTCRLVLLEGSKSKFSGIICNCQVPVLPRESLVHIKHLQAAWRLTWFPLIGKEEKIDPKKCIPQDAWEAQGTPEWFYFLLCAQNKWASSHWWRHGWNPLKSVELNFTIVIGKMFMSSQSFPVKKLHFYLQIRREREIKPLRTTKSTTALAWTHGWNQQPV